MEVLVVDRLVIKTRDNETTTMPIRIEKKTQENYDKLSRRTNRARNELINLALKFAYENMVIEE